MSEKQAALVLVDFKNKRISCDFFSGENSYTEAWGLREAIQEDFGKYCKFRIVKSDSLECVMDDQKDSSSQ